jgi:uncharacterized membrane protein YjjB (DUF3815 family)
MILRFIELFILAFVGSIAPAMVINIEKRVLLWAGLGGALGYCVALSFNPSSLSLSVPQIFVGTIVVGLYSEIMAKYLKTPSTVFCIPGIFPLVPGITAYQTMQSLVENNTKEATAYGLNTIFSAFTIAFGIMIVTALFRFVRKIRKRPQIN